jgi:hypothetical protein
MTREEHAACRAGEEALDAWRTASREKVTPACWEWPVSQYVRYRVARAEAAGDETARINSLGHVLAWWQAGRCAVCGCEPGWLVHDHDHDTGLLRGLLCGGCNRAEGEGLEAAPVFRRYRELPPAVMLGFEWFYAYPDSHEFLVFASGEDPVEVLARFQRETDRTRRG